MAAADEKASVLAGLISKSEDEDVKNVLRLYDIAQPTSVLKKKLASADKGKLLKTAAYLKIDDQAALNKPTVIHNLICRIQNLFPDMCPLCNDWYTIGIEDLPLLECSLCGQYAHTPCLKKKLNLDESKIVTPEEVLKMINPYSIPGFHYLCPECSESTIPSPDSSNARARSDSHTTTKKMDPENIKDKESVNDKVALIPDKINTDPPPPPSDRSDRPPPPPDRSDRPKPTCPFYIKGQCRHGISGKKDGGCPKAHPPLCHRLMTFGDKRPRGCTKGKDCNKLHPKMCPSSLTKRECFIDTCSMYHVKGTKRHPPTSKDPEPSQNNTTFNVKSNLDKSSEHHTLQNSHPTTTSNTQNQIPPVFLDLLQTFKQELLTSMDQKLVAMSQRTSLHHSNQLQAAVPQAAMTFIPQNQMFQPAQGTHQLMFPLQQRLF